MNFTLCGSFVMLDSILKFMMVYCLASHLSDIGILFTERNIKFHKGIFDNESFLV